MSLSLFCFSRLKACLRDPAELCTIDICALTRPALLELPSQLLVAGSSGLRAFCTTPPDKSRRRHVQVQPTTASKHPHLPLHPLIKARPCLAALVRYLHALQKHGPDLDVLGLQALGYLPQTLTLDNTLIPGTQDPRLDHVFGPDLQRLPPQRLEPPHKLVDLVDLALCEDGARVARTREAGEAQFFGPGLDCAALGGGEQVVRPDYHLFYLLGSWCLGGL